MLGSRIKKLREIKGIKQEAIAKALGISQQTYSALETGQTKITGERLDKIAEELRVSIEDIVSFDENKIFENHNFTFENHSSNVQNHYASIENLVSDLKKNYDLHITDLQKQIEAQQKIIEKLLSK